MLTSNQAVEFYHSTAWRNKRREVMKLDHHECVICKDKGIYQQADLVHQVNHPRTKHYTEDVWSYSGDRPTIETKTTVYVVPWPWELEWQDDGFTMRLEVE